MKIYVCLFIEEEDTLWQHYITRPLRAMGHTVFLPPKIGLQESWHKVSLGFWMKRHQRELTEKILADVKKRRNESGLDLFFCYLFPFQFYPYLFKELARLGIPSIYFFCDNLSHPIIAKEYAPFATLNWVPELRAVKQFEASGSRSLYLPMAANPEINYPLETQEEIDISFVGTKNNFRRDALAKIALSGLPLKIYGTGWSGTRQQRDSLRGADYVSAQYAELSWLEKMQVQLKKMKGFVSPYIKDYLFRQKRPTGGQGLVEEQYDDILKRHIDTGHMLNTDSVYPANLFYLSEINKIYGLSSVSIGFNDHGEFVHTNARNFEAAMSGACFLTQATADIADLFEDGKEIMIFHAVDELIEKARFLLKNGPFRKQMRLACRKRAAGEHTWQLRFEKLFSVLGIR